MHLDGHDDLLERGVAGSLAQAVDGALDLRGAVHDGVEGQRRGHAQVVVRVDGDGDVLDAVDALAQVCDARAEVPGHVVARGVRDVDDGGAGTHGRLDDAHEELLVGAAGVLGVELDVVHELAGVAHGMDGALDGLLLGEVELVTQVRGRDSQAGVDARAPGRLERLGRDLDVLVHGTREAADGTGVTGDAANLGDALEVTGTRDGESRLDDVDVHAHELARDDELLLGVHGRAGGLLPVTQGGVKDGDLACHGCSFTLCVARRGHGMRRGSTQAHVLAEKKRKHPARESVPRRGTRGCQKKTKGTGPSAYPQVVALGLEALRCW